MDSPVDSVCSWDHAIKSDFSGPFSRVVSPTPNRHTNTFSNTSLFSVSSYAFSNPSFSHTNSLKIHKPSKQRLIKLFKRSLKYTLKSNTTESNNVEYWTQFHKRLKRIVNSFKDPLSLYDGLNDPYICKTSTKSCCSVIHILCKQFYLYSRSNRWSVAFKIWDSIQYLLDHGANTAILYTKLDEAPQKNYNSIHTLYAGLHLMLSGDIITDKQFANYFSRAISAGNDDIEYQFNYSLTSLHSIESTVSMDSNVSNVSTQPLTSSFEPSVLTLCIYNDDDEWQNITYWMGDSVYNDYYVHLISPYLAKVFIMMGYDLLSVVLEKKDHLNYNDKDLNAALVADASEMRNIFEDESVLEDKVIAFLWFIRYGNFKTDLVHILGIGIKQLALNEFSVDDGIIELILSYSHHFIVSNTAAVCALHIMFEHMFCIWFIQSPNHMDKLDVVYWDEDQWMMTAFEVLFRLDNLWIDWIAQYVMPQLRKTQIQKIKKNLSENTSDKEWNKFIRRISLKSINSFCKYDIFGVIDTPKMQDIVTKNYRNEDLVPILSSANYDIQQTFGAHGHGKSSIFYQIMNDNSMDKIQINAILHAVHLRIDAMESRSNRMLTAKMIINDLLFGVAEWPRNHSIWKNVALAFHSKHKYFCRALNDWFHVLSTEQNHAKLIFFMTYNLIDFDYCLRADLIESALHSLMIEDAFNKKALCVQMIGDWICTNVQNERNPQRKKRIADKAIVAIISNLSNIVPSDRDNIIISQYLDQLITALSQ
eukprot:551424_1